MGDTVVIGSSIDGLLAGATGTEEIESAGKSGARLVRLMIEGEAHVVKYLDPAVDWTLRAAGIEGGAVLELWRRGIIAQLPACIDVPIVGVARDGVAALLMRDVGEWLVPVTDDPVPLDQHLLFVDHMAALHAHFWETDLDIDVVSPTTRYLELSPRTAQREAALGSDHIVPPLIAQGWPLFAKVAPAAAEVVSPLTLDPAPLVDALATTPSTLVHGNWKFDNLGSGPDGRTILLDWETPGRGSGLTDLAWYLAINCRRLPQSKEETIQAYRVALEGHGVRTDAWWERQLGLCLIGALVHFGWEKALRRVRRRAGLVGAAGPRRRPVAGMTVNAYDRAADAWAAGPARVYGQLAEALLDHSPVPIPGAAVLDVGAGTAVVADAARRRGAGLTLASDTAAGMLRHRAAGVPAVLCDAARLPFPDRTFDLVAAGFCLSHLADQTAALSEWRRVAGAVVASAFAPGPPHPAKVAVDDAMADFGFVTPDWYRAVKATSDSLENLEALTGLVEVAGFDGVRVIEQRVDVGLTTPTDVVRWRLGMAQLAPWVASLSKSRRREVIEVAREAVADIGPVEIEVLLVSGR